MKEPEFTTPNSDAQERMLEEADEAHAVLGGILITLDQAGVDPAFVKTLGERLGIVQDHIEAILIEAGVIRALGGDDFPRIK